MHEVTNGILRMTKSHELNFKVESDHMGNYIDINRYMPDGPEHVIKLGPFTTKELSAIGAYLVSQAQTC